MENLCFLIKEFQGFFCSKIPFNELNHEKAPILLQAYSQSKSEVGSFSAGSLVFLVSFAASSVSELSLKSKLDHH